MQPSGNLGFFSHTIPPRGVLRLDCGLQAERCVVPRGPLRGIDDHITQLHCRHKIRLHAQDDVDATQGKAFQLGALEFLHDFAVLVRSPQARSHRPVRRLQHRRLRGAHGGGSSFAFSGTADDSLPRRGDVPPSGHDVPQDSQGDVGRRWSGQRCSDMVKVVAIGRRGGRVLRYHDNPRPKLVQTHVARLVREFGEEARHQGFAADSVYYLRLLRESTKHLPVCRGRSVHRFGHLDEAHRRILHSVVILSCPSLLRFSDRRRPRHVAAAAPRRVPPRAAVDC
mmetsp:Transcript_29754/g.81537  ORF Transcript_29754/g.81537 Transcript_29754/m.81537 type:complete len:282 (-) Transcript_29754:857-1702(-)